MMNSLKRRLSYSRSRLREIFDRTDGHCHICHGKLSFERYAKFGEQGSWEVEHSKPKAKGGTDRLTNLYPACITCNRSKGTRSTRSIRARFGFTRAPYSKAKKRRIKKRNRRFGAVLGGALGVCWGATGAAILIVVGLLLGNFLGPRK
ncbi:HNH endonuclease [Rapidithrix thailandica]|uniref:HNH endonuclease n=1 Tax=Rapidithrix thailandica TaxID=413964 RepID=A0AAW9S675_9BACT